MAITDKEKGVWGLDQVYNKINQGSIWNYSGNSTEPGTLWLWGWATYGVLGQNEGGPGLTQRSSPIQVGSDNNWKMINKGVYLARALKSDGTLWTWGLNEYGQLGLNAGGEIPSGGVYRSSPTQVGSGTDWNNITFGRNDKYASHAVKTDGTLWTWGNNESGQLGHNNKTDYSSPVQVPGTTWSKGRLWLNNAYYIKTNGEMYSWGQNYQGQLGINVPQNTDYSSPKQIPGTTWAQTGGPCAIRTDGTLWVWSHNDFGQLGQNTQNPAPGWTGQWSPTQIPGTTWKHVTYGYRHLVATKTDGTMWVLSLIHI